MGGRWLRIVWQEGGIERWRWTCLVRWVGCMVS